MCAKAPGLGDELIEPGNPEAPSFMTVQQL
jgi:hypothetical protein